MSFDLLIIGDQNILEVHPSALTIKKIADLWNRDTSKDKKQALQELAFIYWMYNWNSSYYKDYPDAQERYNNVIIEVFDDISWRPDLLVTEACKIYEKLQVDAYPELSDLQTARSTLDKLKKYLDEIDPGETTKSGGLVLKPADIYMAISKMGDALVTVQKMEKKIKEEISLDTQKIKGGGKAGSFEDIESIDYLKK